MSNLLTGVFMNSQLASRTNNSFHIVRNLDRSALLKGGGPEVTSPLSRICPIISLVAIAIPMLSSVNVLPLGFITKAPFFKQCSASGISLVTQISAFPIWSIIQLSAASDHLIDND